MSVDEKEFVLDFQKYLALSKNEDVYIEKDGTVVAMLTVPQTSANPKLKIDESDTARRKSKFEAFDRLKKIIRPCDISDEDEKQLIAEYLEEKYK